MTFEPTKNALIVLKKRYFQDTEDWIAFCMRVAGAIGMTDKQKKEFFDVMVEGLFLPNTPCLVNAGKENKNLSACFVLPVEDSMESIFKTLADSAMIYKEGGGVGISFTNLRPEGSMVKTTNGISSGPISFMKIYDEAISQIKAGGVRRGAAIGLLSIDHPDIVKFIKSKSTNKELTNFNISILMTDEFMKQLDAKNKNNFAWSCYFGEQEYNIRKKDDQPVLCSELTAEDRPLYTAQDIYDLIVDCNWKAGDPGMLFIDELQRRNGTEIKAVNPCGESPLESYEACVLGSIDVSKFIDDDLTFDYNKLQSVICIAVDFLNNIVDKGKFPLAEIDEKVKNNRKLGLGIMGWADALLKMKINYGSEKSLLLAKELMSFIKGKARDHSSLRNYANKELTAIAPTGSLSIMANCSGGIEPNFAWEIITNRKDFDLRKIIHPLAKPYFDVNEPLPDYFVSAHDLSYKDHVNMQAAFQNNGVDLGVSKTINLPHNASRETIYNAFKLAWEKKCKGVTIYRDKCKSEQVLNLVEKEDLSIKQTKVNDWSGDDRRKESIRERPQVLFGATIKLNTPDGPAYISVNEDSEGIREVLVAAASCGSSVAVHAGVEGRLISNSLQHGVPVESILKHLKDQKSNPIWEKGELILSLPHAIYKAILMYKNLYEGYSEYLPDDIIEAANKSIEKNERSGDFCPECGENLFMESGCNICKGCGYSKC